jgi:hypothetical protein
MKISFPTRLQNVYKGLTHSELIPNRNELKVLISESEKREGGGEGGGRIRFVLVNRGRMKSFPNY